MMFKLGQCAEKRRLMKPSTPAADMTPGSTVHVRSDNGWGHKRNNDFTDTNASGIFHGNKTIGGGTSRIQM